MRPLLDRLHRDSLYPRLGAAVWLALCLLSACAPVVTAPPPRVPAAPAAASWEADYQRLRDAGHSVLRIDPARSLIAVTVRRSGGLARFGHDHVVASRSLYGLIAPGQRRADFQFRLDQMSVDEPALRNAAGISPQPSADAIDGTRHNMLYRVLDAEHFPMVQVHVEGDGAAGDPNMRAAITLHGVTRELALTVHSDGSGGAVHVSGSTSLKQTDFGLVPFSVMGGALAVRDMLELRFDILAGGAATEAAP